jgi:hypothetical protein
LPATRYPTASGAGLYETLASQIIRTELAAERDWLPMLDYQVYLEELNSERLRVRLEVEWDADE